MNTSPVRARIHFIRSLSAVTLAIFIALALAAGLILILDRQQPSVARAAGETVQFDAVAYSVNEADGTATITVTLNSDPGVDVTVDYATSGGTASAGSDYTDASGTLTFTTGFGLIQTFTVSISGDNTYETDETITLTLSNPTAGTVLGANNPATLTILDNETAPTIRLSASAYSRSENAGPAVITATLTGSTAVTATVVYSTTNNTALAGSDYTAINSTLTFTPGVTSRTFTVALINDTAYEGNETFNLGLSAPVSATLGAPTTAVVTILDDDPRPGCMIFNSADVPKTLPDAAPDTTPGQAESTVTLPGPGIIITDASVRIDQLMHSNTPDLSLYLISPGEVSVLIVYRVGSSGSQNFIHTVLADSFSTPIVSGVAPFTGNFRPDNPLSAFNGLASGGLWRLRILDNEFIDTGTLNAWGLEVCGSVTAPSYHLYVPLIVR